MTKEVKQKVMALGKEMGETMTNRALVEATALWQGMAKNDRIEAQAVFYKAATDARQFTPTAELQ